MKRQRIIHPFLFAVYAVLAVYSNNADEFPVEWVLRPLVILLVLMAALYMILKVGLKDSHRAGLLATLSLFWFFFGHFHRTLLEKSPFWNTLPGILLALAMWTIPLALLGSNWTWRHITNREFITSFLNLTSLFVIVYPLYVAGNAIFQITRYYASAKEGETSLSSVVLKPQAAQPDVYLIVLDAYGREDFLREIYGYDNHEFIDYLEQKGFYVASQSSPNYPQTALSLSSMLNLQYLDEFATNLQNTSIRGPAYDFLQYSIVRESLQEQGYRFVALPSVALFTQMRDADQYYRLTVGDVNEFEGLLLTSTVANFVITAWGLDIPVLSYDLHRRYILYTLDMLEEIPSAEQGPKLVFAHLMAPHPPFVLDADGNPVQSERPYNMGDASGFRGTPDEYLDGYIAETRFLNRRLMQVIDTILAESEQPPVIIVQGDHGPGNYFNVTAQENVCLWERYSMLNAYYFPDGNYDALYESITPVNSFRVILSQYFGADLDVLEDRNYYANWSRPYVFTEVTDQIRTCQLESLK